VVKLGSPELQIDETLDEEEEEETLDGRQTWNMAFWSELLRTLDLDDAEQPIPKPGKNSNIYFMFPTGGNIWLNAYFSEKTARSEFGFQCPKPGFRSESAYSPREN
jgi:hypothetical protein